jgi:hypothetical protein
MNFLYARVAAAFFAVLAPEAANAQDRPQLQRLQGAWVPEGSSCANAFFKQGTAIHFARPGSSKREGILILGNRIEDSRQRCTISKAKMEADRHTLFITCFSGLLVSKLAFSLQFVAEDVVLRTFTDFPEDQMRWRRCSL